MRTSMTATRPRGRRGSIQWIIAGIVLLAVSVLLGLVFRAQGSLHLFDRSPVNAKHVVLLGDSHFEYFDAAEMLNDKRIRNRGISGQTSREMLQRVDEIVKAGPRRVILLAGANDAHRGRTLEEYLVDMRELIGRLSYSAGGVVVLTIPPTTDRRFQDRIDAFNTGLRGLCQEKGVELVDLGAVLEQDGLLDPELTTDGVHLNVEGYRRIVPLLKPHIRG
jgi:lysophospholipase L1-like esterase